MKLTSLILSNDEPTSKRILILCGIAWLPLVLLTLIEGTLYATDITIPFIKDVEAYVRGLIIIPMLVMADNVVEPMMGKTMLYLRSSGVVPEAEQGRMERASKHVAYLINAKWMQVILALIAIAVSWLLHADYIDMWKERNVTSWALHLDDGEVEETFAGMWFLLVTAPMVSFLLYRWMWRFIVWSYFLFRVSRLKLELFASHSDQAGGLGIIGYGQNLFGFIFFIMATLLSSELSSNLLYEGEKLVDVKLFVLVFIAISIIVITAPLLFFSNKLVSLKRRALAEYGELQQQISRDFHHHWIDEKSKRLVDSIHPSSMADYSAVYEVVSSIRIVPINPKSVIVLAAVLLVPFLPLALTESSVWDVLHMIGESLL